LSLEEASVEFDTRKVVIEDKKGRKCDYYYASPKMIVFLEKEMTVPEFDVEVDITWNDIQTVLKFSSLWQLSDIAIWSDGEGVKLGAFNPDDPQSKKIESVIDSSYSGDEFRIIVESSNLKLMKKDYKLKLAFAGITCFESDDITYYIACEAK